MKKILQLLGIITLSLIILQLIFFLVFFFKVGNKLYDIAENIEDGDFKIEILDKYIDEYKDKEYSDRVNIQSNRILIIKDNDTIVDVKSEED
ncbi:hypothetical protein N9C38_04635 [Flavobacteriaceae bacterium]|nr:hypothetical protein [Flavobacteriaceae bacterium]MDA9849991.1 hypothetical protein [Flavobacteriaceae bacterium]MDB2599557.1 hypothetical protein [Flavobacteriaceae bacterium]